jgi:hypothetical protein
MKSRKLNETITSVALWLGMREGWADFRPPKTAWPASLAHSVRKGLSVVYQARSAPRDWIHQSVNGVKSVAVAVNCLMGRLQALYYLQRQ